MNVRVAMLNAKSIYGYRFTTETYCPYGGFLVSYNGIYSSNDSYWELQVNGVTADYGMDFQQLNANDNVNWVLTSTGGNLKKSKSHQHIMAVMHLKNIH